jgi:ion channel-forming bestrophin family protein
MFRPWVAVLTSLHSTPIAARIWGAVAVSIVYAALVCWIEYTFFDELITHGSQLYAVLGLVLGTLLVFRTNTSYDRWWEGRKLWGQLVNDSRNLAIKVETCVQADEPEKDQLGQWLIDFAYALKGHLRGGIQLAQLPGFENSTERPQHVPAFLSEKIYDQLERWRQADEIGGFELLFLDQHASSLMNVCGACERIQKSPISISYRWFIRQSIAIYLITLPWGLVKDFDWWTIAVMALITYFMLGVELIAEEIEDPFGDHEDDLKLDDICRTIERSVKEIMNEPASVK